MRQQQPPPPPPHRPNNHRNGNNYRGNNGYIPRLPRQQQQQQQLHNQHLQQQQWTPQRLLCSTYKDLGTPANVTLHFQNHLISSSKTLPSLLSILLSESSPSRSKSTVYDYSLQVDIHDFISADPVLGNMLLRHSETLLPLLEEAIVGAQREILIRWRDFRKLAEVMVLEMKRKTVSTRRRRKRRRVERGNDDGVLQSNRESEHEHQHEHEGHEHDGISDDDTDMPIDANVMDPPMISSLDPKVKGEGNTRVHARLVHLPPHSRHCKPSLASLTSHDLGKILQLSGTVVRTSKVQMVEYERAYRCCEKKGCGRMFFVRADLLQWNNALPTPSRCQNQSCKSKTFIPLPQDSCRSDYQEIKVQESLSNMSSGGMGSSSSGASTIPRTLLIKLTHDLVDQCQPGDDVVVVGTLNSHWQNVVHMADISIGMSMHAHSIRVANGGDGAAGGGSSWDCIFDGSSRGDVDGPNGGDKDGNNKDGRSMVREEIVREFRDYWNDDEVNIKKPIAARNFICRAVCPTLYGLSLVKLALLLVLIGGSRDSGAFEESSVPNEGVENSSSGQEAGELSSEQKCDNVEGVGNGNDDNGGDESDTDMPVQFSLDDDGKSNPSLHQKESIAATNEQKSTKGKNQRENSDTVYTRRREQSHLLLVGDPGCGKSQFLRFATALCPRSVLASGSGTTSAGLTCAAVREDSSKEWTLEAGALVLADRGVCAIDEFSCINPKDRTTIHEAMEQQTLSVAKAGIVCKLNCRATVIAVTNAKAGYYDHNKSFTTNVGIEPPLLSRFDLIFKLIDGSDASKDDNIATFLLNRAIQGTGYECTKKISHSLGKRDVWGIDKLRAYVATVKAQFRPVISHEASILLERHYAACRSSPDMAIQITVRFLESLIRLAQAHASLMYRNVVELDDAVAVILLVESSVASCTHNDNNSLCGDPTLSFPDDDSADIEFVLFKVKVLERYDMQHCISAAEHAIIESEERKVAVDPALQRSWEKYENNSLEYQQHRILSPEETTYEYQATDHYGRLTQKATPSPAKKIRNECTRSAFVEAPQGCNQQIDLAVSAADFQTNSKKKDGQQIGSRSNNRRKSSRSAD